MLVKDNNKKIEITEFNWPLAEDLFIKWGHSVESNQIEVKDIDDVTPELSAWGIPWKWTE